MSKFTVQFLSRNHCPLCDEARPLVMVEVASYGGAVEEVDVDTSDDLRDRFGSRIPVLLADDGSVIAEGRFKRRFLRKGLRAWRRSRG